MEECLIVYQLRFSLNWSIVAPAMAIYSCLSFSLLSNFQFGIHLDFGIHTNGIFYNIMQIYKNVLCLYICYVIEMGGQGKLCRSNKTDVFHKYMSHEIVGCKSNLKLVNHDYILAWNEIKSLLKRRGNHYEENGK